MFLYVDPALAPKLELVLFAISYFSFEMRLDKTIESWRAGFYRQVFGVPSEGDDRGFQLADYSYIALYTPREAYSRVFGDLVGVSGRSPTPTARST